MAADEMGLRCPHCGLRPAEQSDGHTIAYDVDGGPESCIDLFASTFVGFSGLFGVQAAETSDDGR